MLKFDSDSDILIFCTRHHCRSARVRKHELRFHGRPLADPAVSVQRRRCGEVCDIIIDLADARYKKNDSGFESCRGPGIACATVGSQTPAAGPGLSLTREVQESNGRASEPEAGGRRCPGLPIVLYRKVNTNRSSKHWQYYDLAHDDT